MGHARIALGLGIAVLLAGCDTGDPADGNDQAEVHADAPVESAPRTSARVGPIRYQFDPTQLIMAEVLVEIPPDYDDQLWGAKLIPTERADLLGEQLCRYGQPDRTQTCEANREPGLVLALLTRPLDHYYQAFAEDGLGVELDGSRGFTFTSSMDGGAVEYRFLPLRDRTVLVAWQSVSGSDLGHDAIRDVIRSVSEGLETLQAE